MKIIAWERISWSLRPGHREQGEIMTFSLNICCIYCKWPPFHCHLSQHHCCYRFSGSQSSAEGSPLDPRKNVDRYIDIEVFKSTEKRAWALILALPLACCLLEQTWSSAAPHKRSQWQIWEKRKTPFSQKQVQGRGRKLEINRNRVAETWNSSEHSTWGTNKNSWPILHTRNNTIGD